MLFFARFLGLFVVTAYLVSLESFNLKHNYIAQAQTETQNDQKAQVGRLLQRGTQQFSTSQIDEAFRSWEQALAIAREIGCRRGEVRALGNLGIFYETAGQLEQAVIFYQQSLAISRKIGDQQGEANALGNLGNAYSNWSQYDLAIDFLQQQLSVARAIGDQVGESNALGNLGNVYSKRGQYDQAINFHQQALVIDREFRDQLREAQSLGNLGSAYLSLGQYQRTIDFLQRSLNIQREIGDRIGESLSLGNLGNTYFVLGQYQRAINLHWQSLNIQRDLGYQLEEANSLGNLGDAYSALEQYEKAIDFYQQSLIVAREVGNQKVEGGALNDMGIAFRKLNQYEQAIKLHQASLMITRDIGDRQGETLALSSLSNAYSDLGEYEQAIDFNQQSLAISREIGDSRLMGIVLSNLGRNFANLDQSELAIVFLKASVDIREEIRGDIQGLETNLQQSYTDTIADSYRFLANLLLEEGRIPEAQQVLDLLKLEELREFTDNTRATWTSNGLEYSELEQPVIEAHTDLIAFGQTFYECQQTGCEQLKTLNDRYQLLVEEYNNQVKEFESTIRDNRRDDFLYENPDNLSGKARELLEANPNSVLIYPVVTDEKLWLLYATARSVGSIKVNVSQGELSRAVQRLGELLSKRGNLASLQATSQDLYGWLIEPLEEALESNDVEQLIFVNDRVTRYIPMAVLHDGEQYLIERYAVSSVLSPALTNTDERLGAVDATNVLGLGLTKAVKGFNPLPAVAEELDTIVRSEAADATGIYPGQVHLDEDFTLERLESQVASHRVLHIATHAAFKPGRPDASFIVLGDGNRLEIPDIEAMELLLSNLHLVVLSACQTALGGEIENGDGSEIAGLSSYFLEKGRAEAVLASLWLVDDTGTSLLMQRFYELMALGELTKAEALQQAQLSLLYDQDTETRLDTMRASITVDTADGVPIGGGTRLQHPFYWAPFILIGNGL